MYDFMDHLLILNEYVDKGKLMKIYKDSLKNLGLNPGDFFNRGLYVNFSDPSQLRTLMRDPNVFSPYERQRMSRNAEKERIKDLKYGKTSYDLRDMADNIYKYDDDTDDEGFYNNIGRYLLNPISLYPETDDYITKEYISKKGNKKTKRVLDPKKFQERINDEYLGDIKNYKYSGFFKSLTPQQRQNLIKPNGDIDIELLRKLNNEKRLELFKKYNIIPERLATLKHNREVINKKDIMNTYGYNTLTKGAYPTIKSPITQYQVYDLDSNGIMGTLDSTRKHEEAHNAFKRLGFDMYGIQGVRRMNHQYHNTDYELNPDEHNSRMAEIDEPLDINDRIKIMNAYLRGEHMTDYAANYARSRQPIMQDQNKDITRNIRNNLYNYRNNPDVRITPQLVQQISNQEIQNYNNNLPEGTPKYPLRQIATKPYYKITPASTGLTPELKQQYATLKF